MKSLSPNRILLAALALVICGCASRHVYGDDLVASTSTKRHSDQELAFFEKRIRPRLVKHCYECHSADSDELGGGLRLDFRAGVLAGGESGPALIPGKPGDSLIVQSLRYDGTEMPPDAPLPESVVADFEKWIAAGAADPRTPPEENAKPQHEVTKSPDDLWSLKPIEQPAVPPVRDSLWPTGDIDRFVLSRIEAKGLTPANDANARRLVNRIFYDLIGLPPTRQEMIRFEKQARRDRGSAIVAVVDELLSRPQFGQRWGRHWLDVARFGESNGNDGLGRNPTFPHAWRYRDYVIHAFNEDVPYDQFLLEQIAGDLLEADSPEDADRNKVATGFLAMAAKPAKAMNNDFAMDVVADQIEVIGSGVMGLSVGCARCHDHKFDPIPTNDYYALAGIFTSTETMWGAAGHEALTAPATDLHVLSTPPKNLPPNDFVETVVLLESATGKPKKIPKPKWPIGTPLAMGVRDKAKPADCQVNINGDSKKLGKPVPRGFLSSVRWGQAVENPGESQSGRLELAQWLIDPNHPLTARVFVNRVWLQLFGEGIVRTPDDFGVYGERPTHPLLLDFLASRFVQRGWSTKSLIREIVLSRTYQLSCDVDANLHRHDSENRWLTRHNRRRLDAEALRDSMLFASGQLDLSPGQGSIIQHRNILVNLAGNLHQQSHHRSVYLCYLRSAPPPELAAFDLPDFSTVVGKRESSVVPLQTLHLLNSPLVVEQASRLGRWVCRSTDVDSARVCLAYERVLRREPTGQELTSALELVRRVDAQHESHVKAWAGLCQALLMTNEFRYVD